LKNIEMKEELEKTTSTISRREALKKAGMYAAFTAAASIIVLAPKHAQATSPPGPGWGKKKR
jgi:hypothetical protein